MSHHKPKINSGGWGALLSSAKYICRERVQEKSKGLLNMNQQHGFDCPGCAWGDPIKPSAFEICENGVKAFTFEATDKTVPPEFFAQHKVQELMTWDDHHLEKEGRLTHPMSYNPTTDHYEEVTWNKAFSIIAEKIDTLSHPNRAVFYTSGRTSNEAAFLYQLMGRKIGTNNFPDCSNLCHESSGVAMTESIGVGKGTVSVEDFHEADAIFVIGQNPGTNHPRMLTELEKASKRGAKILSFNPLKEAGLMNFTHPQDAKDMILNKTHPISTHYYQPKIGGDMAAFRGIVKAILEREEQDPQVIDWNFIKKHCHGFESYQQRVQSTPWPELEEKSGLAKSQMEEAAEVYCQASSVICCWAMGLTQHRHGVSTIQEVLHLLFLKGNIGRPGAGPCPVRGHSNVQGDRTVGITEFPSETFLTRLDKTFNMKSPRAHGLGAVATIQAMNQGDIDFFMGMGGNFAAASPDTEYCYRGLRSCAMTVHVSTHLNRSHLVHGEQALILPCLGRSEKDIQQSGQQFVTVEDSMSRVHASKGSNWPASPTLMSEPSIVAQLSAKIFPKEKEQWLAYAQNYDLIRDDMEQVLPEFESFNQRVKTPRGFVLPNTAAQRIWKTHNQKANFIHQPVPDTNVTFGHLVLMTVRSHDQYNTTIYGMDDRYRGIKNERRIIFMNPIDIVSQGLQEGDIVDLISHDCDQVQREAKSFKVISYDIPKGCAASYFPETNPLVGIKEVAYKSHTPMSKFIDISLSIQS